MLIPEYRVDYFPACLLYYKLSVPHAICAKDRNYYCAGTTMSMSLEEVKKIAEDAVLLLLLLLNIEHTNK